tara:strand:- start:131 stop:1819 length:1689 start_codon:yes stop_codon:yes gene_type:complete
MAAYKKEFEKSNDQKKAQEAGNKALSDKSKIDDCCATGQYVDPKTKACTKCPPGRQICGAICCKANEKCCGGKCCDKSCDGDASEGNCCEQDQINDKTKKCCDYSGGGNTADRCCNKDETPRDGICQVECGSEFCDPNKNPPELCQKHTDAKGNSEQGCVTQTCEAKVEWSASPANLYPPSDGYNAGVPVGVHKKDGTLWFCSSGSEGVVAQGDLQRDVHTKLDADNCTATNCWGAIADESGAVFSSYNDDGTCSADVDCKLNDSISESCKAKLATDEGQTGWGTGILNPSSVNYNKTIAGNPNVMCKDDKGMYTGQICDENKTCVDGECKSRWVLEKLCADGNVCTGSDIVVGAKCRQFVKSKDAGAANLITYADEADCQEGLQTLNYCPQGFVAAGTTPNQYGCYRYGPAESLKIVYDGNPAPYCQDSSQASKDQRMKSGMWADGGSRHSYCSDIDTDVPEGAYFCATDPGAYQLGETPLKWMKCDKANADGYSNEGVEWEDGQPYGSCKLIRSSHDQPANTFYFDNDGGEPYDTIYCGRLKYGGVDKKGNVRSPSYTGT